MRVTALKVQQRNNRRVNVYVDNSYRFSLDASQLRDLGIHVGSEYNERDINNFTIEGEYKTLYDRSLSYVLVRPRSLKEVSDYLYKKTRDTLTKNGKIKKGVSPKLTTRVLKQLVERGYLDDETFARYWVENRSLRKGASRRTIQEELRLKGVNQLFIDTALKESERNDGQELLKIIAKKQAHYQDDKKLTAYLLRQGFLYEDIKDAISIKNQSND